MFKTPAYKSVSTDSQGVKVEYCAFSILNIVKHLLHVWVAVTRLLVQSRARTSFSSASSGPFLAAMDRKNSSQAADGGDQVNNEDTSQDTGGGK